VIDTCLNCKDRKPFCHDSCEKYLNAKKKLEEANKRQRQFLDGYGYDGCLAFRVRKWR
jgi:hypothetical protein